MQVDTKYNINDTVYIIENNIIIQATVNTIEITAMQSSVNSKYEGSIVKKIRYKLAYEDGHQTFYIENVDDERMFSSVDDLLLGLKIDFEKE